MTEEIIKNLSLSGLKQEDFNKLKKNREEEYSKIRSDLKLILAGQKVNQKDLRLGFIGLVTQNSELLELNKKLSQQLERVEKEFNVLKKEREEKITRKEARANRKRLPKSQPITLEIYRLLIQVAESPSYYLYFGKVKNCFLSVNRNWNSNQQTLTFKSRSASNITRISLNCYRPFKTRTC